MLPLDVDTDWNSAVSGTVVIVSGTISFLGRCDVGVDICLSYPAGAAAGSYIASVSSSSSFFFFFFFLSTSLFLLQLTWYDHVTQVIFISLMTATKLMGLEIHLGSFGVTGVKKVNHVKNMKTALI